MPALLVNEFGWGGGGGTVQLRSDIFHSCDYLLPFCVVHRYQHRHRHEPRELSDWSRSLFMSCKVASALFLQWVNVVMRRGRPKRFMNHFMLCVLTSKENYNNIFWVHLYNTTVTNDYILLYLCMSYSIAWGECVVFCVMCKLQCWPRPVSRWWFKWFQRNEIII